MSKKEFPQTLQFFDKIYDDGIPKNNFFTFSFNAIPSIYHNFKNYYDINIINYFKLIGFK